MREDTSRSPFLRIGLALGVVVLLGLAGGLAYYFRSPRRAPTSSKFTGSIANNHLMSNSGGESATFSTHGSVDLPGEYFQPKGPNGQSCASCHIPEDAWSITPSTLQRLFDETGGSHPVFTTLDANNPEMDVSTSEARRAAYRPTSPLHPVPQRFARHPRCVGSCDWLP